MFVWIYIDEFDCEVGVFGIRGDVEGGFNKVVDFYIFF